MQKVKTRLDRPMPWPRSGQVSRLYLNAVRGNGVSVYISQSNWPRHQTNPQWRIHIEGIDPRYATETRNNIQNECLKAAYDWLSLWLQKTAPILTIECATWQDLVQFSTCLPSKKAKPMANRTSFRPGRSKFHPSRSKSASRKPGFKPEEWN